MFSCGSHNGFISTINAVLSFQLLFLCFHFYSTVLGLGQPLASRRNVCSCYFPITVWNSSMWFITYDHATGISMLKRSQWISSTSEMETIWFSNLNFFCWCKNPIAYHLVTARVFLIRQVISSATKVSLTRKTENVKQTK